MIEEFPFTTRVLQAEKDINSLKSFIAQAVREVKERLALLTWARLTWEQRVAAHTLIHVQAEEVFVTKYSTNYIVTPINVPFRKPIKVETLSQMQFGTLACGN